ncbi:MAG: PEP-utilizing enzyme [Candidatus Doudnabacteria bacterium]
MKNNSVKILIRETNVNYYAWAMIADGFLFLPHIEKYLGAKVKLGLQVIKDESGQYGFDIDNWFDLGRRFMHRLEDNRLDVKRLYIEHVKAYKKIMNLCSVIQKEDLTKIPTQKIGKWLKDLWQPYLDINSVGFVPVVSDFEHNYLTNKLISILRTHDVGEDKVQLLLSELITPTKINLFWKEKKELLELAKKFKSLRIAKESSDFKKHINKYAWLNYGYQGPVGTEKDFTESLERIFNNRESVVKQLEEHKKYFGVLSKRQNLNIKKLKLNKNEKKLFSVAKDFVYLKGYRVEARHNFSYTSDLLFNELTKRFKLHPKIFRFCTRKEITRVIRGKTVDKKAILKRIKHTIESVENKKRVFYTPKEAKRLLSRVVQKEQFLESTSLKGQTAFPGLVRGKVKIVHSTKDLSKVQHGDILIAITTNPDFMSAMHRALAFVTDVGGITSHAAIVAREMKKPCVIGTKFATKILKDNDIVEVDANKGIVNIIE